MVMSIRNSHVRYNGYNPLNYTHRPYEEFRQRDVIFSGCSPGGAVVKQINVA